MARSSNLQRRKVSGVHVVRLYVPAWLQAAVGHKEVHRSTGCRDPRQAKIVAAEIVGRWHAALDKYARMDLKKIEAGSLDLLGEGYILVDHAATQLGATHGEVITHLLARSAGFYVYRDDWEGWLVDDMGQLYHEHDESGFVGVDLCDSELAKHGRRSKLSPRHLQLRFAEEVLAISQAARQPVDVSCFMLPQSRTSGFVVEIPGRAISVDQLMVNKADVERLRSWLASRITPEMLAEAAPPRAPAPADTPHHGLAHAKHAHLPLADVLSIYIDRNRGKWKPNTLHTNSDRCAILLELMGNLPLKDIDRDSLWRVVEKLRKLPDGRQHVRRRFKRPEATFTELIDLAEQHHLPRLSTQAVEKLVDAFSVHQAITTPCNAVSAPKVKRLACFS